MGFPSIHRPHSIVFPSGDLTVFTSFGPSRQFEILRGKSSSEAGSQWSGVVSGSPMVRFGTPQLKKFLDLVTIEGMALAVSSGTVSLYYRKGTKRGLREAPASVVHDRFDMVNTAFLYWEQLQADSGQVAEVTCVLKAVSNDGLNPFVHVGDSALAGTSIAGERFTLGPQKINGSLIDSVVRVSIDNQVQADDEWADGHPYSVYSDIEDWQPRLRIETNDINVMDAFEEPVPVTSLESYFRKLKRHGLPEPDATAEHVRFTTATGMAVATEGTGLRGRFTVMVTIDKSDAATPPFVLNTATAIT